MSAWLFTFGMLTTRSASATGRASVKLNPFASMLHAPACSKDTNGTSSSRQTSPMPVRSSTFRRFAALAGLSPTDTDAPLDLRCRMTSRSSDGWVVTALSGVRSVSMFGFTRTRLPLTAAFGFFATRIAVRSKRHRLAANVDTIFATEYSRTIALGKHDNLRQVWDEIRDETAEVVRSAPLRLPFFGEFLRHRLEKASERLFSAFRRDTQSA